jgi:transcriptional regulator with XRE-family HTH domain
VENTRKLFTENLKKIRNAKGLTQAKLAELTEISLSGYAKIEYGESWPTPGTMGLLAEKLGVNEADFFQKDEREPSRAELLASILLLLPSLNDSELRSVLTHITNAPSRRSQNNSARG